MITHWFYFDAIVQRDISPKVSLFDYGCFNSFEYRDPNQHRGTLRPGELGNPLQLIKNLFRISPVFFADGHTLIVNRSVLDALIPIADIKYQRVRFVKTWLYPFGSQSRDYETDDAYNPTDIRETVLHFAEKFRVNVPDLEYYELVLNGYQLCHVDFASEKARYQDCMEVKLFGSSSGRNTRTIAISRSFLEEKGLCWSGAFNCSPSVFQLLSPFLDPVYIYRERFSFDRGVHLPVRR